jgi:hypothetical protein
MGDNMMTTVAGNKSYASNSHEPLKQMDQFLSLLKKHLVEKYGEEKAASIRQETLIELERIIPELPDIGGKRNLLFQNLIQSGDALALYRVLVRQGGTAEEAGELVIRGLEGMFNRIPTFLNHLNGRLQFSKFMLRKMQEAARRSQEREYPGDWVFEIVVGDGQSFDYGIDYTECAIVKFMNAQDANELTPYLCNTDYVVSKAAGTGLRRSMTLAWGCEKCDFRYVKGGKTLEAWPPKFIERQCGEASISTRNQEKK